MNATLRMLTLPLATRDAVSDSGVHRQSFDAEGQSSVRGQLGIGDLDGIDLCITFVRHEHFLVLHVPPHPKRRDL